MKTVNIATLKNQLSLYLNEVRAGHEVLIRDRNTPIAKIVPISPAASEDEELQLLASQGKIRLSEEDMDESFWDLPAPRVSRRALLQTLRVERDEE
jgi:prevent-host-death family protein